MKTEMRTCTDCGGEYEHEPMMIFGNDILASIYCCPKCSEIAEAAYEKNQRETAAKAEWEADIEKNYRETNVNHPDYHAQNSIYSLAKKWQKNDGLDPTRKMFLGIIGESGLCKTRIIAMVCKQIIWEGGRVLWINSSKYQWAAQNQFDDANSSAAKSLLKRCHHAAYLVMDDIGSLKGTEIVIDSLYSLIEYRTANALPILWTSNETIAEMFPTSKVSEKSRRRCLSRLSGYSSVLHSIANATH